MNLDAGQLGELIDEHAAALELYAAQWTAAPEDCVQEAFIELVRQERSPENTLAWLYRVVRNRALNAGRSQRRRERHERLAAHRLQDRLEPNRPEVVPGVDDVTVALSKLAQPYREIVILRLWSQLNLEEIATISGCSTSTAHRRYRQALEQLRKLLEVSPCPKTTTCP